MIELDFTIEFNESEVLGLSNKFCVINTLNKLLSSFNDKRADVGVFSESNSRSSVNGDGIGNAKVGEYHERPDLDKAGWREFGSPERGLPPRPFLRKPAWDGTARIKIEERLKNMGKDVSVDNILDKVSEGYLEAVKEEFYTWGHGEWQNLKEATWKRKKNPNILRETEQLFRSISRRIK